MKGPVNQGHYTEGAEMVDSIMDVVRKEAEGCDCLQVWWDACFGHILHLYGLSVYSLSDCITIMVLKNKNFNLKLALPRLRM